MEETGKPPAGGSTQDPVMFVAKKANHSGKLAALVITTVIIFIFVFASASSWTLFASHALPAIYTKTDKEMFNVKAFGIFAGSLTLVTIGLALAFGFATKDTKAKVPLDFNTLLKNVQTDFTEERHKHKIYVERNMPFEI